MPRGRGRHRTAVADTSRAAMSRTHTGCTDANSRCGTCSRAYSASGTAACSATSSGSCSASSAPSSSASAAPTSPAGEQRAGRCKQQCRYGCHCNKLGYPRHDDLLLGINPASRAANADRHDHVPPFSRNRAHKGGLRGVSEAIIRRHYKHHLPRHL